MGLRITPDMKSKARNPQTIERFIEFAKSIRCIVIGDAISCGPRQKPILLQWWKDHKDDE